MMFSFIVPVYNVKNYLAQCIDSVLGQSYKNYEIILIDDGSTDGSEKICDEYARQNPSQIHVIHQRNQGLSVARNTGMKTAKGKYIVFLDSDDMISVNALENLQSAIIKQHNPTVIISRRETIINEFDETMECAYYFPIEELANKSNIEVYEEIQEYPDMLLGAWIFTIAKEYMDHQSLFFYPGLLHEDEEWVPRVFFNCNIMGYNNDSLYIYRPNREGSITSVCNIRRLLDRLVIVDELGKEFEKDKYNDEIRKCINHRRAAIIFGIIYDLKKYKRIDGYQDVVIKLNDRLILLKESNRVIYRLTYYFVKCLGVYNISCLLEMWRIYRNRR